MWDQKEPWHSPLLSDNATRSPHSISAPLDIDIPIETNILGPEGIKHLAPALPDCPSLAALFLGINI